MHPTRLSNKVLIHIPKNLGWVNYIWAVLELGKLSTPRLDYVTCVEISPSSVEFVIGIICGLKNIVISLHVLSY